MTTTSNYSDTVRTAREYYNSEDADAFYSAVWGGEDIHVGIYQSPEDKIADASRRTVQRMASKAEGITTQSKVLDIGAGYGGAARFLAKHFGCHVTALNLSEVENNRNRQLNAQAGLDGNIDVVDGSFEELPFENETFDLVWSQDAILHSGNREKVIAEAARVLKSGGEFLFTDPMQSDNCPEGVLQPILDRIHLSSLGSPGFYRETAAKYGLQSLEFEDLTDQLVNHYSAVLRQTELRHDELVGKIGADYLERMKKGLRHWIDGGNNGYLAWGVVRFRKI